MSVQHLLCGSHRMFAYALTGRAISHSHALTQVPHTSEHKLLSHVSAAAPHCTSTAPSMQEEARACRDGQALSTPRLLL